MTDPLLPAYRTPLEEALSQALGPRLLEQPLGLAGFKLIDPADGVVSWLVWEYGLGELMPYLVDPRRAIAEGVRWQRIRGTPASALTALRWVGFDAPFIEERAEGYHWPLIQIDPGRVASRAEAAAIAGVGRLSLPARSRLVRLYHCYDLRPVVASGSVALDEGLLGDDSGVMLDGVKQSWGLFHAASVDARIATAIPSGCVDLWGGRIVYADDMVLDAWELDSFIVPNRQGAIAALDTVATEPLPAEIARIGRGWFIPRAAFVASESVIGDVNSILGAYGDIEEGALPVASGTEASGYALAVRRVQFDEVFDDASGSALAVAIEEAHGMGAASLHVMAVYPEPVLTVLDGEPPERVNHPIAAAALDALASKPYGGRWPRTRWTGSWRDALYPGAAETTDAIVVDAALASTVAGGGGELVAMAAAAVGASASLAPIDAAAVSAGPYAPLWPTARWSRRTWRDPSCGLAVTALEA